MKILIPYDGSEAAAAAIHDLRHAGLPTDVKATVLSVADVWLPPPNDAPEPGPTVRSVAVERARTKASEFLAVATQLAETGAELVRKQFPGWSVQAEAVADSPAWAVIKRSGKSDLVVMGCHGHSPISRLMFGSVSQKVIVEAECSVRIGRTRREKDGAVRILAGLDGSVDADATITAIAVRSWPAGSEVRLLTSIDANISTAAAVPTGPLANWLDDADEDATGWVSRMLNDASARLCSPGLIVSSTLVEGDAKQSLLREAETWAADAIFVGARGRGLFERLLLGSVSSAVAARAHCSVEIVRTKTVRSE